MIFCVEDDAGIRDLMVYTLNASGFTARGFSESLSFWAAMEPPYPQLILLDIMLPGEDGIEILKKLRAEPATKAIPVIMATAKDTEYDKVLGLDLGADDDLSKPFGMMEMLSRIRAVLRRAAPREERQLLTCGGITLDKTRHSVTAGGRDVTLTLKEFNLLCLLMENPDRVFSRDALLDAVWGDAHSGETRTVDVHIGTLRTKLGDAGSAIQTVRGVGYRMEAEE